MAPKGWQIRKLDEVLEKVIDPVQVNPEALYEEIGIRSHGKGIFHKAPILGKALGDKRVFWVKPDCFVVNIVFAWEQAVARTTDEQAGKIASHRFPLYRPKPGSADVDYLLYFFKTPRGKYLLELASPGGAGRNKTLGQKEFGNLEFLMPSAGEQKKIARILSTWDKAIRVVEELIENSKAQKKAMMQQLLMGKRRFPGFENSQWQKVTLSDLVQIVYGKSPADILCEQGAYPVLGTGGKNGSTNTAMYSGPSVVIGRKGTIDRPRYVDSPFWASDTTYFCIPKNGCDIKWFYYLSRSLPWRLYNEGSGVPSLSRETIGSIRVSAPCIKEQARIAQVLTVFERDIEKLEAEFRYLQTEKKALTQQLLSGKRRVKVDES